MIDAWQHVHVYPSFLYPHAKSSSPGKWPGTVKNDTVMTLFIEREVVGIGDRCAFTLAAGLGLNKVTMDQKQEGCTFNLVLWI